MIVCAGGTPQAIDVRLLFLIQQEIFDAFIAYPCWRTELRSSCHHVEVAFQQEQL